MVRMRVCLLAACAALLPCATAAFADLVYLKSGGVIEGRVIRKGDKIIVETLNGRMSFDAELVSHIVPKETDGEVFQKKIETTKAEDTEGFYELGLWAASRRMRAEADTAFRKAIAGDPNHLGARTALGYVKHDGKWVTEEQRMRALGFVQWQGQWVPPEAKADLEKLSAEKQIVALKAEIERLKLERAEVERDRAEAEAERAEAMRPFLPWWPWWGVGGDDDGIGAVVLRRGGHHHHYGTQGKRERRPDDRSGPPQIQEPAVPGTGAGFGPRTGTSAPPGARPGIGTGTGFGPRDTGIGFPLPMTPGGR